MDAKALYELSKIYLNGKHNPDEKIQIQELIKVLHFHEWKYAVQNSPVISDKEYDTLYKMLEALELKHTDQVRPDSPTQRVSSDLSSKFPTVPHLVPMLSLDNSYNLEDLQEFDKRIKKLTGIDIEQDIEYVVEPKFDGGSIALVYEEDQIVRGATRGNGVKGDQITANVRTMKSVPLSASFSSKKIAKAELRGEALIRKDNFQAINTQRETDGLEVFANPRNAATGGLRMKDPKQTAQRGIEAFIYQMGFAENANGENVMDQFETHYQIIELLGELGFKIPAQETKVCPNIKSVFDFVKEWEVKRDDYPYEIDGMVIKVNNLQLQEQCGYTSHHPRWAIAFKFKAKQATSKLINVEYQIGKIGSVTPVAKIEPVALAGVTVSSVSLHNEEFIVSKDLRLGDAVLVERAGDVIPYIVKSMEDLRDGTELKIDFPKNCPSCDTALIKEESEAAWRCPNTLCEAQALQRMVFHVSKPAMDIDGFGKSIVEKFYELGFVKNIADIYDLDYDAISKLEGFGERSINNLQAAIAKAKENPISRLLHSLSIHHLGKKASKLLAQEINHVMDLSTWNEERFTQIKDIGPVVAKNVMAYFAIPENLRLLSQIESYGVNLTQTEEDKPLEIADDAPLVGKSILFTGTLSQVSRKEAQGMAAAAGAKNISAVSSKLNILVVGEKAGSKLKKAKAIETVQIITEQEFLDLLA